MIAYVLDTDMVSLWHHGHPIVTARVKAEPVGTVAVSVITVQEQLDGWHLRLPRAKGHDQLARLYTRLAETVRSLSRLPIVEYLVQSILRYEQLQTLKLNMGKMDQRIAAICLELNVTLVTRNFRDFQRVPGLRFEDWSV